MMNPIKAMTEKSAARGDTGPKPHAGVLIALLAIACVVPFFLKGYHHLVLTQMLVYAIAILGLNILTGYNGQISLGHGAFYAIGAYTAAIMMDKFDLPYWSTVPAAGAICLGVGFLFGLPALRLAGHYLALATFALAVAVPQLLKYKGIEHWTGGVQGINILKPDPPFGLKISADLWLYFFTLAITVIMFVLAYNLLRGRIGRALVAIRDQPIAAEAMGINLAMYKSLTFGVSALYTGVAGALGAIVIQYVAPDSFTPFLSISILVGVVVGGLATLSGALYGAAFVQFAPNIAEKVVGIPPQIVYGLFLIGFMYIMPLGVAWFIHVVRRKFLSRQPAKS
jgi:branched-chain amino acid transport system permease protein